VVLANGQPWPGPLRFWSVTAAALMRACWSALLLPVGKLIATLGLWIALPACTFATSAAT
jgi:hypothetical protein